MDINSQIYESDLFSNWCLGAKGGKHPANFTSMCKCVTELGISFPAGEEGNQSEIGDYGTYTPTVGNETIVIDHIGTIGSIQVSPKSIASDPSLARACQVDKDHIPICADVLIRLSVNDNNHERRREIQYDISKVNDQECAEAFRARLRDCSVVGVEVKNSTHCHLIQHYIHEAVLDCFLMPKDRKRKST